MNTTTLPSFALPAHAPAAARAVLHACSSSCAMAVSSCGCPTAARSVSAGGEPHAASAPAQLERLRRRRCARATSGFAESYMAGDWTHRVAARPDRPLLRNQQAIERCVLRPLVGRLACCAAASAEPQHPARQPPATSVAHYDLGNAFYRAVAGPDDELFVGLVRRPARPVAGAGAATPSTARAARWLASPRAAACWRSAAAGAACRDGGARARRARHRHLACRRAAGLCASSGSRAPASRTAPTCGLQDYRDIADRRSTPSARSRWWRRWAGNGGRAISPPLLALLKPGGRACIQTIMIDDALWDRYIAGTDFIQQYIFPGGCLPRRREFERHAARRRTARGRHAGLRRGLRADACACGANASWRSAPAVRALGFDERFIRLWEFYLAYCAAAFATGTPMWAVHVRARLTAVLAGHAAGCWRSRRRVRSPPRATRGAPPLPPAGHGPLDLGCGWRPYRVLRLSVYDGCWTSAPALRRPCVRPGPALPPRNFDGRANRASAVRRRDRRSSAYGTAEAARSDWGRR